MDKNQRPAEIKGIIIAKIFWYYLLLIINIYQSTPHPEEMPFGLGVGSF